MVCPAFHGYEFKPRPPDCRSQRRPRGSWRSSRGPRTPCGPLQVPTRRLGPAELGLRRRDPVTHHEAGTAHRNSSLSLCRGHLPLAISRQSRGAARVLMRTHFWDTPSSSRRPHGPSRRLRMRPPSPAPRPCSLPCRETSVVV